jgi:hypothetical protein
MEEDLWGNAPRDVLVSIFKRLPVTDLIRKAALVNRKWSKIARSNQVWANRLQMLMKHPQFEAIIETAKFVENAQKEERYEDLEDIYSEEKQDYLLDMLSNLKLSKEIVQDARFEREISKDPTFFYRFFLDLWIKFGHVHIWRDPKTKRFIDFRSWQSEGPYSDKPISETPVVVLVDEGEGRFSVKQNPSNMFTREQYDELTESAVKAYSSFRSSILPSILVSVTAMLYNKYAKIIPDLYNAASYVLNTPITTVAETISEAQIFSGYSKYVTMGIAGILPFLAYGLSVEYKLWDKKFHNATEKWYRVSSPNYCVVVINKEENAVLYVRSQYSSKGDVQLEPVWIHDKGVDLLGNQMICTNCNLNEASFVCKDCGKHFFCSKCSTK